MQFSRGHLQRNNLKGTFDPIEFALIYFSSNTNDFKYTVVFASPRIYLFFADL